MFVKNGLLEEYCQASKSAKYLTGVPITWDSTKGRINCHKLPFRTCLAVTGFLFVASSYHLIKQKLRWVKSSDLEFNIGIMLAAVFGAVFHMTLSLCQNECAENALITGFISFEKGHNISDTDNKKLRRTKQAARMLRLVAGYSTPVTLSFCAAFLVPGLPMNVLSYSPGKELVSFLESILEIAMPTTTWIKWTIVKVTVYVLNWYAWAVTFRFGIIFPNQVILFSNTFTVCVSVFNRFV